MSALRLSISILFLMLAFNFPVLAKSSIAGTEKTQSSLSKADIVRAKQWKLTEDEYERYKQILTSPRAYFTPGLDKNPLLALALESGSDVERARYAEKWVQIQYENNIKVISWAIEVDDAWKRQFPGTPRFAYKNSEASHYAVANMNKAGASPGLMNLANNYSIEDFVGTKPRAQLFLALSNCGDCIDAYRRQYQLLKSGRYSGLDLHFISNPTKEQIIEWAKERVLDSSLNASDVNESRVVTLNSAKKTVNKVPFLEFD